MILAQDQQTVSPIHSHAPQAWDERGEARTIRSTEARLARVVVEVNVEGALARAATITHFLHCVPNGIWTNTGTKSRIQDVVVIPHRLVAVEEDQRLRTLQVGELPEAKPHPFCGERVGSLQVCADESVKMPGKTNLGHHYSLVNPSRWRPTSLASGR